VKCCEIRIAGRKDQFESLGELIYFLPSLRCYFKAWLSLLQTLVGMKVGKRCRSEKHDELSALVLCFSGMGDAQRNG